MNIRSFFNPGFLGLLGIVVFSPRLWGGGFTIIEMGSKKTGMMTGIAKPDDLSTVYHNPAGLADLHGTRLHLSSGFSFVNAGIRLKAWPSPGGGINYGSEDFIDTPVDEDGYFEGTIHPTRYFGAMPMLVASSDFGFKEGPVLALSVFLPDFIGAFLPEDAPTRYMVVEGYFTAGVAALTGGYRLPGPMNFLSLGASAGLLYVRMEGKRWNNFPVMGKEYDINSDMILSMVGEDYRFFWNVGICADVLPQLTLGLSFIGGTEVELKGRLEIDPVPGKEDDPVVKLIQGRYAMSNFMQIPAGLATGIHWAIIPELDFAADFRYWFYQVYEQQEIAHSIHLEFQGKPVVPNPMIVPKDYEGSWTLSAGFLVRPLSFPLELMTGWTYDHSPAPSQTKSLDSPTVNLTGFSLGARYTIDERWRLALTYYRYWYLRDVVDDSILDPPQNAEFEGSVDTVSVELEVKIF